MKFFLQIIENVSFVRKESWFEESKRQPIAKAKTYKGKDFMK